MRRAVRWTLNVLTLLSALLALATSAVWVRSNDASDSWNWEWFARRTEWRVEAIAANGFAHVSFWGQEVVNPGASDEVLAFIRSLQRGYFHLVYPYPMPQERGAPRLSIRLVKETGQLFLTFSLWHLVLVCSLLPALRGITYLRRQRQRRPRGFPIRSLQPERDSPHD